MGTIETTYDRSRDLTLVKAIGRMTADNFQEWTANYYAGAESVTSLVLWDLTQADLLEINTDHLRDDATLTKRLSDRRKGGKTAIVTGTALEYGLSRMLEAFYDIESVLFEVRVFHTIDNAMEWLGVRNTRPIRYQSPNGEVNPASNHNNSGASVNDHIKIYKGTDFIRLNEEGNLDVERSCKLVRELSTAADFHRNHHILVDLRETEVVASDMSDLMDVAAEFIRFKESFQNKIAVLIPDSELRLMIAKRFKALMDLQGFQFKQFTDFEAGFEWLSVGQ